MGRMKTTQKPQMETSWMWRHADGTPDGDEFTITVEGITDADTAIAVAWDKVFTGEDLLAGRDLELRGVRTL